MPSHRNHKIRTFQQIFQYLKQSITFNFAARRAGKIPAKNPIVPKIKIVIKATNGI